MIHPHQNDIFFITSSLVSSSQCEDRPLLTVAACKIMANVFMRYVENPGWYCCVVLNANKTLILAT